MPATPSVGPNKPILPELQLCYIARVLIYPSQAPMDHSTSSASPTLGSAGPAVLTRDSIAGLMQAIAPVIRQYFYDQTSDLRCAVSRLETEIQQLRESARPGRDGLPGAPGTAGRDGRDGAPGNDGLGFDDLTVDYDGDRTLTLGFAQGDRKRSFPAVLPIVLDRGVWRDGQYIRGDAVTYAGALWIARRPTTVRPGEGPDNGWRLAVKAPRHGKSAFELARLNGYVGTERQWLASLRGSEGRPGRDGRNW